MRGGQFSPLADDSIGSVGLASASWTADRPTVTAREGRQSAGVHGGSIGRRFRMNARVIADAAGPPQPLPRSVSLIP